MGVHIMRSTTSTATITKLREIFATHGLSETIVSDKGGNFTSAEFEKCLAGNGIKHTKVSSYHPASNDQADRAVRAFKDGLEKMEAGHARETVTISAQPSFRPTFNNMTVSS